MILHYILEGHETIPVDLMTWARWLETTPDCRVAREQIGDAYISTIFRDGLDHRPGNGTQLMFQTMVFGGPLDKERERCSTWAEAEEMHRAMCERVRNVAGRKPGAVG